MLRQTGIELTRRVLWKMSAQDKAMLYSYIEDYIPTWFRKGIVQLRKDEIMDKINDKGASAARMEIQV